jgi:hypothetical protein
MRNGGYVGLSSRCGMYSSIASTRNARVKSAKEAMYRAAKSPSYKATPSSEFGLSVMSVWYSASEVSK